MIKSLALIRDNGKGKVLNVADGELRRLVAKETASGSLSSASILIRVTPRKPWHWASKDGDDKTRGKLHETQAQRSP